MMKKEPNKPIEKLGLSEEDIAPINNHSLFRQVVRHAVRAGYGYSKLYQYNIESLIKYLVTVNHHMFFTMENITNLTNYINDDLDARSFILNLTDATVLEFLGLDGDLDAIVNNICLTVRINKNYEKLYDNRLADSLRIDLDTLKDVLENNSYLIVMYYVCIYVFDTLESIEHINTSIGQ